MFNYNIYAQIARKYLKEKGANIIDPTNRFYRDDRFMIGKCQSWVCDQHLESDYRAFQEAQLGPLEQRQNLLNIDIAKTKKYYAQLTEDDLCDCESCQYYRSIIEQACPEVTAYFLQLGIDIRKPYHLSFVDTEDGNLLYIDCDYLAFGDGDFAYYHKCGEQEITGALIYPDPDFEPPYVMLQINQVILPSAKTEN